MIKNSKTGQTIRFIQTSKDTAGSLLEMESSFEPYSKEPVPHYHPQQEEDFTILEGSITVRIWGKLKHLEKGETLHIPKKVVHSMWNSGDQKAIVNWRVYPALQTEQFLETAMGISANKKTNDAGMPGILQVAIMANNFSDVFRLSKPSFAVQKCLFTVLSPIARLKGLRPVYEEYID